MEKKKILLVEDDALVRETLARSLTQAGFEVIEDADGKDTVRTAAETLPDAIALDIRLPDKRDGITILRELKKHPKTAHIPVLMLTNLTDQRVISATVELGARGYFVKSDMSYSEVIRKVEEIVGK